MYGYYLFGFHNHYKDILHVWEFVLDSMESEGGLEDIIGVKAAPGSVAIGIILVCIKEGGVITLCWYFFGIFLGQYVSKGDLLWDVIKDRSYEMPSYPAEPISAIDERGVVFNGIAWSYDSIIKGYLLYVGCVVTRLG